jgi:c-di-GMP-binding flagellar brake protein YcgR
MSKAAAVTAESHEFLSGDLPAPRLRWSAPERRVERRDAFAVRAALTILGRSVMPGRTLDVSRGGASMIVPFELALGQICYIDFELEACGDCSAFHIAAEVRYCVELGANRHRVGMQFRDMDEKTAALIASLLGQCAAGNTGG